MKIIHDILLYFFIFLLVLKSSVLFAYNEKTTHPTINEKAVLQSIILDHFLKEKLGIFDGILHQFSNLEIIEWTKRGGQKEDATFSLDAPARYLRHFHDPLEPWSSAGLWGYDSSLVWAQQEPDANRFSWRGARALFYSALTTGSESDYADMFRAIGQVMHLLSDAAVPAHVRNDPHPGETLHWISDSLRLDMYEKWASDNYQKEDKIDYTGLYPDAAIFSRRDASQASGIPISALWDQNIYDGYEISDTWNTDLGLAEFTNANFVSQDTKLLSYSQPDLAAGPIDTYPVQGEDGKWDLVFYAWHPEMGYRLATLSFTAGYDESVILFGQDDAVFEDYAAQLIPRAVGYSTALLEYFFRGALEISAPACFVYGIIDGSNLPHQFTTIKAGVRNATIDEALGPGTLTAVARYKRRTDYLPDLATDPPLESSREASFSYAVSRTIEIAGLSATEPAEFTFDFSNDPIPAGITDLYLQIVFKGTLGSERDIALAVGMKDLNEPDHHVIWNSTDQVVYNGTLYSAGEIKENFAALADLDNDGVFNETAQGEPYIDPYQISYELTFSKDDLQSAPPSRAIQASINDLPPARYSRIIILTDIAEEEIAWLTAANLKAWTGDRQIDYYSFQAVLAQETAGQGWNPTELEPHSYTHRSIGQHHLLSDYICLVLGSACSYLGEQRPGPLEILPFPVSIDF